MVAGSSCDRDSRIVSERKAEKTQCGTVDAQRKTDKAWQGNTTQSAHRGNAAEGREKKALHRGNAAEGRENKPLRSHRDPAADDPHVELSVEVRVVWQVRHQRDDQPCPICLHAISLVAL